MARWLGVTAKTVRELAKVGIAVRAGRGQYGLEESVTRYCEHIRRTASRRGDELSLDAIRGERLRIAKQTGGRALALNNALARGKLLPAGDVEAEWSVVLRNVRVGMLSVPTRAAARFPHLTAHDSQKSRSKCG